MNLIFVKIVSFHRKSISTIYISRWSIYIKFPYCILERQPKKSVDSYNLLFYSQVLNLEHYVEQYRCQ